jgi:predicted dehydrogenase
MVNTSYAADPIRLALVGYGDIARRAHGPHLADRPDLFEVRAVADHDDEALRHARRAWPEAEIARSIGDLDLSAVDAGVVLTSDGHVPALTSLIDARKPTLVEKPVCFSPVVGRSICDRADALDVPIVVGYMRRYCQAVSRALECALTLSEPIDVKAELWHPLPKEASESDSEDSFEGRLDALIEAYSLRSILGERSSYENVERLRSYFLLITSGIHLLNLVRCALVGAVAVDDGSIYGGGLAGEVALSGDRGVANLRWAFTSDRPYSENMRIEAGDGDLRVDFPHVYGTGVLCTRVVLKEHARRSEWSSEGAGFAEEYRSFFEVVRSGRRPVTGAAQGVEDLEAALQGIALARLEPR